MSKDVNDRLDALEANNSTDTIERLDSLHNLVFDLVEKTESLDGELKALAEVQPATKK